jgi:HNH endonuclease
VDRGHWPTTPATTLPIAFKEYGDAKPHLVDRIGLYCSYCELPIPNQPAVEHILPKSQHPELQRTWCNFLLACAYCNSIKGARERLEVLDYFWPDRDNTMRALSYGEGGLVGVAAGLPPVHEGRARRTIDLTGLDRDPIREPRSSRGDPRSRRRREAWDLAVEERRDLEVADTARLRERIVKLALATGFWSVWMTVFAHDRDMRRRLIAAFPGTARACFDEEARPIARPAGAL